jgi:nucleotide-binding universal stress UspA family protein
MRNIMVATDGSSGGDRAVDVGAELARAVAGTLLILTVAGALSGDELRRIARAEGDVGATLDSLASQVLLAAKGRAQRAGVPAAKIQTGWGDPAQVILETAQRGNIDAIVMGRRGRGQLAGLLLGSVSQKVTSLAPCVVIIVP